MKMTLGWYKDNLIARRATLRRELDHIQGLVQSYARHKKDIDFLELQIKRAKERGLDAFDDTRFLVPLKREGTKRTVFDGTTTADFRDCGDK